MLSRASLRLENGNYRNYINLAAPNPKNYKNEGMSAWLYVNNHTKTPISMKICTTLAYISGSDIDLFPFRYVYPFPDDSHFNDNDVSSDGDGLVMVMGRQDEAAGQVR